MATEKHNATYISNALVFTVDRNGWRGVARSLYSRLAVRCEPYGAFYAAPNEAGPFSGWKLLRSLTRKSKGQPCTGIHQTHTCDIGKYYIDDIVEAVILISRGQPDLGETQTGAVGITGVLFVSRFRSCSVLLPCFRLPRGMQRKK